MTSRIFKLAALLAAFSFVAIASACPKDSKCSKKKEAASLTSATVSVDGRTEGKTAATTTPCSKKGCGGTGCDKPDCCKNKAAMAKLKAETEAKTAGKGCTKPCCKNKNKQAAEVAAAVDTAKGTPCSSKCASCPDCKNNPGDCANCPKCKGGSATVSAKSPCSEKGCDKKDCCKKKGATVAAGTQSPCGKKCGTKKSTAVVGADGVKRCPLTGKPIMDDDCPIGKKVDAVLTSLPKMKYKIGEEVTCCSKSAAAMAKNTNTKMKYLVGDDVFETEKEATAQLVAAYEMEVNNLNSMQFAVGDESYRCPMTAKDKAKDAGKKIAYRVAGFDFPEKSKAEDTLKKIAETVAEVKMSYKVGDQKFCCDKMAGAKVKETGSTMSYIVGDEETTDEFTAKILLAETKIRTIVQTAAASTGS